MDFWIIVIVMIVIVSWLCNYYRVSKIKEMNPLKIGRIISMFIGILFIIFSDSTNLPWLFIGLGIIMAFFVLCLNVNDFEVKNGVIITIWQFLFCSVIWLAIIMYSNDKMQKNSKHDK